MASTLTAGDVLGIYQGYYPAFSAGSLSPDTFGGFTCTGLITGATAGSITASFTGNAASFLSGKAISVNGTAYSTITSGPTYDSGSNTTSIEWAYGPGNFTVGNSYTIDIGAGGPVNPNITSPSTVPNLIGTKLAHTVTIDKTAASMAITGGADSADFEVTGTTGLRFASDALSDTAGDLVVEVTVTDTDGLTATQTITVPVKYILYVGGKTWSRAGATSTTNVSLTDLTGGIASAPAENDYVVVMQGIGSNADRAVATTSGYTELADIYANGTTYDANLGVDAKFMGSTPDTTVTIGSSGSANDAQAARIMVFRGVDLTTPMDVVVVTATGTGTAKPNPGAITPITTGSVGVFSGAQAAATAAALTSSDLTAFASVNQADTNDIAVGAGYIEWSGSGAMDPAVFGGGSNNSANSWAAASIALRPAYTSGGVDVSGATTLSGVGALLAAASINRAGKASVSATGTLAASAGIDRPAIAAMSASGSLSATATKTKPASASLAASSALSAQAEKGANATVALSGAGSLAASATVNRAASSALTANAALAASGFANRAAVASLGAQGAIAATAGRGVEASAAMTGASDLAASPSVDRPGTASLDAVAGIYASPTSDRRASASLSATGALTATTTGASSASVSLSANGSVAAAATVDRAASVSLDAASALVAEGHRDTSAAADLSASASLTAMPAGSGFSASVSMAATSSLSAVGSQGHRASVDMSAAGEIVPSGRISRQGIALLSGAASIAIMARLERRAMAALSAVGSMTAWGYTQEYVPPKIPAERHAISNRGGSDIMGSITDRDAETLPGSRAIITSKGRRAA